MRISFYNAAYVQAFGSIFPTEDICSKIPNEHADVAILEEPEHLNWFRVPESEKIFKNGACEVEKVRRHGQDNYEDEMKCRGLGWANKFRFVVGICHTNYAAYVRQYGIGASVIAAPVITAFNSLVVRAYCHKVIKLSGILQSFAPGKEVTSNVHGVRQDFLDPPHEALGIRCNHSDLIAGRESVTVYFVGKLLWAKGFDSVLQIQERYRQRTGNFFRINIYGTGPDEKAIIRAFHGRHPEMGGGSDPTNHTKHSNIIECVSNDDQGPHFGSSPIFSNPASIRRQSCEILGGINKDMSFDGQDSSKDAKSLGFKDTIEEKSGQRVVESVVQAATAITEDNGLSLDPVKIIGDLSNCSINTGIATSVAAYRVGDVAIKNVLGLVFTSKNNEMGDAKRDEKAHYIFDPLQSLFELRRSPVPAHFLGVKDHSCVKNSDQIAFLNPSISEVLCTTTAEALAMGKFAIIPHHPSNAFFAQFPNCLMYTSVDEAVDKLIFAMSNTPQPLSNDQARTFTWEAATDRLIKASAMKRSDAVSRLKNGAEKTDRQMSWLHTEAAKTTQFIRSFLPSENVRRPEK